MALTERYLVGVVGPEYLRQLGICAEKEVLPHTQERRGFFLIESTAFTWQQMRWTHEQVGQLACAMQLEAVWLSSSSIIVAGSLNQVRLLKEVLPRPLNYWLC